MKKKIEKRANIKANKQRFVSELKKKRCALKNRETKKKREKTDELMLTMWTMVQSKSIEQDEASPLFPSHNSTKKIRKRFV